MGGLHANSRQERMKLLSAFNSLYTQKGLHPGSPYFFFANTPIAEQEAARRSAGNDTIVVKTAYSKQGVPLEGFVAVFVLVEKNYDLPKRV